MQLTDIIEAHEFHNKILEARDALKRQTQFGSTQGAGTDDNNAALQGIAQRLDEIIRLLKDRR